GADDRPAGRLPDPAHHQREQAVRRRAACAADQGSQPPAITTTPGRQPAMTRKNTTANVSGDLVGVLTIVFVVLKLLHKITWSWWWVLSPLWITGGLVVAVLAFVFAIAVLEGWGRD